MIPETHIPDKLFKLQLVATFKVVSFTNYFTVAESIFRMFQVQLLFLLFISLSSSERIIPGPIDCLCPITEELVCCRTPFGKIFSTSLCECLCSSKNEVVFKGPCRTCQCKPIDRPVCCEHRSQGIYTTKNSCECKCTGRLVSYEKCKPSPSPSPSPKPDLCICPKILKPVCCKRKKDGKLFTASNSCTCECEGKVISKGECPTPKPSVSPDICICPLIFKPVCCKKNDGTVKTESNACFCECDGKVLFDKPCPVEETPTPRPLPCTCPLFVDPVCCKDADGKLVTKSNSCFCGCVAGTLSGGTACNTA